MHIAGNTSKSITAAEIVGKDASIGETVNISPEAVNAAHNILLQLISEINREYSEKSRIVIALAGGSGAGKSSISSVLSYCLNSLGVYSYHLSGDNYPRRIPVSNDAERLRIYRTEGIKALLEHGLYSDSIKGILHQLWMDQTDSDANEQSHYSWIRTYQDAGRKALGCYLGNDDELDYDDINRVISSFKAGESDIWCKLMGKMPADLWYDQVHFPECAIMLVDWTHALNEKLTGTDISVLLFSRPSETKAIRVARGRDRFADSPFASLVIKLEQDKINSRASSATMIVDRNGNQMSTARYLKEMEDE